MSRTVKVVGDKLMQAREAAGKTRSDMAEIMGITHVRLWQIETGQPDGHLVSNLNKHIVKAVCGYLKIKQSVINDLPEQSNIESGKRKGRAE